jgi:hypothetical protein
LENIQDTVVFFGSARVHSRQDAEQALQVLQKKRGRRTAEHARLLKVDWRTLPEHCDW